MCSSSSARHSFFATTGSAGYVPNERMAAHELTSIWQILSIAFELAEYSLAHQVRFDP